MAYYTCAKRILIGGVPCKVAPWVGELGNDSEYREAVRPRDEYKATYYEGGFRVVRDGIPCRMAGYVADWSPWMKRALLKGTAGSKESEETKRQMARLAKAEARAAL